MKTKFISILLIITTIAFVLSGCSKQEKIEKDKFEIVTSFYPMYIIALNITEGAKNVEVHNMTDNTIGCLHNYTLKTSDLMKIENADVYIQNGLGIEDFMDKVTKTYPNLEIIEAGENVENIITEKEETNAHIWNNVENYITEVQNVANRLAVQNKENAEIYKKNAETYINKLSDLKQELFKVEKEEYVLCFNESLEYILEQSNLKVISVETDHDENALSAENISKIVEEIKDKNIKAIFIEKADSDKNAQIIVNEINIQIHRLDSSIVGDSQKDSYINAMKENNDIIRNIYGVK